MHVTLSRAPARVPDEVRTAIASGRATVFRDGEIYLVPVHGDPVEFIHGHTRMHGVLSHIYETATGKWGSVSVQGLFYDVAFDSLLTVTS